MSCSYGPSSTTSMPSTQSAPLPPPAQSENLFFETQIQIIAAMSLEELLDTQENLPAELEHLVAALESEDLRGEKRQETEMHLAIAQIRQRALPERIHDLSKQMDVKTNRSAEASEPSNNGEKFEQMQAEIASLSLPDLIKRRDALPQELEAIDQALNGSTSHAESDEWRLKFRLVRASLAPITDRIASLEAAEVAAAAEAEEVAAAAEAAEMAKAMAASQAEADEAAEIAKAREASEAAAAEATNPTKVAEAAVTEAPNPAMAAAPKNPQKLDDLLETKKKLEAQIADFKSSLTRPNLPNRKMVEQRLGGTQDRLKKIEKEIATLSHF